MSIKPLNHEPNYYVNQHIKLHYIDKSASVIEYVFKLNSLFINSSKVATLKTKVESQKLHLRLDNNLQITDI